MDVIKQLGALALATRMKRLSERFTQDVTLLYQERDIDFEPRWFPIYYLLSVESPLSILDIAKKLGITHPAVNQFAGEMIKHGIVEGLKDDQDKRKRLLTLTDKGRELLPEIQLIWRDVEKAAEALIEATGVDILGTLERMEWELDQTSFYARIQQQECRRKQDCVEIVEYRDEYESYFKRLNLEWIEKYFAVEPADERILGNPRKEIIEPGGKIFSARYNNEIVGTCALIHIGEGTFELAKMAVTEKVQGKQIGRKLLLTSIHKARDNNAKVITLETNSKLTRAIQLYRRCGFVMVPFDQAHASQFSRVDTVMKLDLTSLGL